KEHIMILSFAKKNIPISFEEGYTPRLLTASNITVGFSQHPRILHNHDDRLELLFIRTGSGSYIVGDECFDIKPGNIIVCNPGVLHDELPEHNRHLSMLSLAVTNLKIKDLPKNHLIPDTVKPILRMDKSMVLMESIFQSIFDSLTFGSESSQETNIYLTQALLSLVLHAFEEYGRPAQNHFDSKDGSSLLHDIKQYIDENYAEKLSIPQISEKFFISQSYLSHLFKKKLGFSPMQYIARRRIGEAQSMLVLSDKSVTDIAIEVGFDNLSHFNVQFKKYVGLSPMTYRKKYILPDPENDEDFYV
ncbi:MAG: AraC family transcriptional regulator, partial [Ruminococcus sp.]